MPGDITIAKSFLFCEHAANPVSNSRIYILRETPQSIIDFHFDSSQSIAYTWHALVKGCTVPSPDIADAFGVFMAGLPLGGPLPAGAELRPANCRPKISRTPAAPRERSVAILVSDRNAQ